MDIGAVVLAARSVLVSGRVITPAGYRARHIGVEVQVPVGDGELHEDSDDAWIRHPDLDNAVFTDESGAFTVFASDVGGPYRLVADAWGGEQEAVAVLEGIAYGTTDLVVPLVLTGAVSVKVDTADDRIADCHVVLCHDPAGPIGERRVSVGTWLRERDGTLLFSQLLPGTVRLELRALDGQLLGERTGLYIEGGRTTDAGVLTVDPALSWISVALPGDVSSAILLYGPAGSGTFEARWTLYDDDPPYVPVRSLPIDILVRSPGYRRELLRGVAGDVALQLREGPRVDLRLIGASELGTPSPGERRSLRVRLEPSGGQLDSGPPSGLRLDPTAWGSVELAGEDALVLDLELEEPGPYAVSCMILVREGDRRRESPWCSAGEIRVEGEGGRFDIRVPEMHVPD